jgi:uncharacterized protein (TIGR02599 family)
MINPISINRSPAFTIIELLVSTAVLSAVVMIMVSITNQTASTWKYTAGKMEQFSGARDGFEALTRRLGQATLNTYYDYYDADSQPRTLENAGIFVPKNYGRQSELRFACGGMDQRNFSGVDSAPPQATDPARPRPTHGIFFHAPTGLVEDSDKYAGLHGLLNTQGYYVEFDSDQRDRPPFLQNAANVAPLRWRFRLMEFMQPAEKLLTYSQPLQWFAPAVNEPDTPNARVLAENVVALIIQPMLSPKDEQALASPPKVPGTALAPNYFYDSTKKHAVPALNSFHQLPPNVRVTMVVIDEASAIRLADGSTMPDLGLENLFRTDLTDTAKEYDRDLETLQATLAEKRCSHRVFTTNVIIRGAKWSKQ